MTPFRIPASTITASTAGTIATAVMTIVTWAAKQFWSVDIPVAASGAVITIATVLATHNTDDEPAVPKPAEVAAWLQTDAGKASINAAVVHGNEAAAELARSRQVDPAILNAPIGVSQ